MLRPGESPASKVIPLETAFVNLNAQLRFLELEVRRTKSEVDEQVYWVLVDQTERVAAANAKRSAADAAAAAAAADDGAAAAAAAPAASSSSGKKGSSLDAGEMAKFLNPSLFSEAQILYYKALVWMHTAPSLCLRDRVRACYARKRCCAGTGGAA